MNKYRMTAVAAATVTAVAITMIAPTAFAGNSADGPFISQTGGAASPRIYGKTYGEWAAAWWQWAGSFPADANPVGDETGELCDLGQSGPVWFLAGTFGGMAERECTIPAGKAIFYPILNAAWVDCAEGSGDEDFTDEDVRWILANFTSAGNNACQLTSTLDTFESPNFGEQPVAISALSVPAVRSQSPVFSIDLPPGHILEGACGDYENPPGDSGRAIAEGYWAMLPPLSVGEHELTLYGAGCEPLVDEATDEEIGLEKVFETEVIYHLTVVPGKGK